MSARPPKTAASSARLSPIFEKGSGEVLATRRDEAFAVCAMRLVLPAEKQDDDIEGGSGMTEHLNGEERAADRTNDGVNGVPGGVDPRNFIGEKLQEIEDARDRDDGRMAEHFERLILRRERDPMLVNRQTGDENGEVKIDPGEAGETERNPEKVELFHGGNMRGARRLSRSFGEFLWTGLTGFQDCFEPASLRQS